MLIPYSQSRPPIPTRPTSPRICGSSTGMSTMLRESSSRRSAKGSARGSVTDLAGTCRAEGPCLPPRITAMPMSSPRGTRPRMSAPSSFACFFREMRLVQCRTSPDARRRAPRRGRGRGRSLGMWGREAGRMGMSSRRRSLGIVGGLGALMGGMVWIGKSPSSRTARGGMLIRLRTSLGGTIRRDGLIRLEGLDGGFDALRLRLRARPSSARVLSGGSWLVGNW